MGLQRSLDPLVGRVLGEFVLRERIGEGGFGAVYRASQHALDREAVVKVLHARLHQSPAATERFLREAKLASKLDHPYAAHIYAFGAEPDGQLWIAMELVRGTPLDAVLKIQGPLALERFVPLFDRICEVVHTAHEQGIVHRDLKPANVMVIARAGRLLPKLLDFGIAKGLEDRDVAHAATMNTGSDAQLAFDQTASGGEQVLTARGVIMGSPLYMAPEQWTDAGAVDARTDLYALGVLGYECLTGRPPFEGPTLTALASAHGHADVPALGPQFPAALDRVFATALAKQAADRYPDALSFASAFRAAAGLDTGGANLPVLALAERDAAINSAPQPIAEAVAAFDAARNVNAGRDALVIVVRTIVRYLGLLALASRARSPADDHATEAIRSLTRHVASDTEWLELTRMLTRAWIDRRDAYPIPELIGAAHDTDTFAELAALAGLREETASEAVLEHAVARVSKVLQGLAFVRDYSLVVTAGGGVAERWMGVRRQQRSTVAMREKTLSAGVAMLIDKDGAPVLSLSPLVKITAPVPGAPLDLFLFEGRDRRGARMVALPSSFEHHDDELWDWFRAELSTSLEEGEAAVAGEKPPYRGLVAFSADDGAMFFGREKLVDAFVNRLKVQPLLTVVGRSGAGKSSFVHAGVVPALPTGWRVLTLRPGPSPLSALAARLEHAGFTLEPARAGEPSPRASARPATLASGLRDLLEDQREALGHLLRVDAARRGPILLVVDQLEEMFALCTDVEERRVFAEAVATAARSPDDPVRVVFTLRDDFLVRTEQVPALRNRIGNGLQLLTVPVGDDLIRIVSEPARRLGYELEGDLASEMVREVADQPGALALLSFTASKLWDLRDRQFKRLTRAAYKTLGGVGGALARHADLTLDAMPAEERALAREAFRHLVTTQNTRAVLPRFELRELLGSTAHADRVIEKLVAARLLVASENESGMETIEVVHEALLVAWPRLADWHREDSEGARFREQLRSAAKQWAERGRGKGLLWRGDALADYTRWRSRHAGPLTDLEAAFADASLSDAARGRRNRSLLLTGGFTALIAIVVIALVSRSRIADQKREAVERKQEAEVANSQLNRNLKQQWENQGRLYILAGDPQKGVAALAHAADLGVSGPAHEFLMAEALRANSGELVHVRHDRNAAVRSPRFSPKGDAFVTAGLDGKARIWDARTGDVRAVVDHGAIVARASFSPDGATILTASFDGTAALWDSGTGARLHLFVHHKPVWCAVYAPDGSFALTASEDDTVVVWDLPSGHERFRLHGDGAGMKSCAISPNGRVIAASDLHGTTRAWSATDGALLHEWRDLRERVLSLRFSPDGTHLLAAGRDLVSTQVDVVQWEVASGRLHHRFTHAAPVVFADYSPDGQRIVTASDDRTAVVWDAVSGARLAVLAGHVAGVTRAVFSPDGAYIVTTSEDATAWLWDVEHARPIAKWVGHQDSVVDVAFSPDGHRVLTGSDDGSAIVWDVRPQEIVRWLPLMAGSALAEFSADGRRIMRASIDGTARLYDAASLAEVAQFGRRGDPYIWDAAVNADGTEVATASTDGAVRLWDLAHTVTPRLTVRAGNAPIRGLAWRPDGAFVVACDDGYVRGGSSTSSELRFERKLSDKGIAWVSFDPRRPRVLAVGDDGFVYTLADNGELLGRTSEQEAADPAISASFDPEGKRLLEMVAKRGAKIVAVDGGAPPITLIGHAGALTQRASWSPDGRLVVTASVDGTVRVWDAATGDELAVIPHRGYSAEARFAPDGRSLLVAADDGSLMVYELPALDRDLERRVRCRIPFEVQGDHLQPRDPPRDCAER